MSRQLFNTDAEYKLQLFKDLIEIVTELGWSVALPSVEEDEEVPGMIIGNPEYVDKVTVALKKGKFKL